MPLPPALATRTIEGTIQHLDLPDHPPATGKIAFMVPVALRDTADNVILGPGAIPATLDANGFFTVDLPVNDDPDVSPQGWAYTAVVSTSSWRASFEVLVPSSLPAPPGVTKFTSLPPAQTLPSLVTYLLASLLGAPSGVANLGPDGKIPSSQLPATFPPGLHATTHAIGGSDPVAPATIGAEIAGAAASTMAAHIAAADPHSQYLTQAEADSFYALIAHIHTISQVIGLQAALDAKADDTDITALDTRVDALEIAPPAHDHDASDIISGVLDLARIPSLAALYLALTGGTITGNVLINKPDDTGAYEFRVTGSGLDLSAAGHDLFVSVWSGNTPGVGVQRTYMRLESGVQLCRLIGKIVIGTNPFNEIITLDPNNIPNVTGSQMGNPALASLLTALASRGFITDSTTA